MQLYIKTIKTTYMYIYIACFSTLNATCETAEVYCPFHNATLFSLFLFKQFLQSFPCLTTRHVTTDRDVHGIFLVHTVHSSSNRLCWFAFYNLSDRDLLFAHVQTSAGLLFFFYDHLCCVATTPLAPKSNPVRCAEFPDIGWIIPISQSYSQMLS